MEQITRLPPFPPRPASGHKGTFGTVLVGGGSRGMAGAVALAGRAALVSGAGLARLAVPDAIFDTVAAMAPCCTTVPLPGTPSGRLHPQSAIDVLRAAAEATVVALGPGLGCDCDTIMAVRGIVENLDRPLIMDADALNAVARIGGLQALVSKPGVTIITPHPGEAARLLRTTTASVQADRETAAARLAEAGVTVLLKGQGTLVTDGRRLYVNHTGNSGMATGGSGDVLTGVVAALVAQGMSGFEAAVLAAHVHGAAGDLAAKQDGEAAVTAESILRCLPAARVLQ